MTAVEITQAPIAVTAVSDAGLQVLVDVPGPVQVVASAIGIQGPPGSFAGARYTHSQPVAAVTWTVNHNIGAYPLARVFSAGSVEVEASITHLSVNQLQIDFNAAQSGFAVMI